MNVPLLDLKAQYRTIRAEIDAAVAEVFESQYFILGPKVKACEEAVARYSQCAFGIGVSSGTDALLLALMAEGVGPGDEVITSPYTFFATAGSVARLGATPVFVDIDPATFNLDPRQLEAAVGPKTKAIIPVHLYGQMADMDPIMDLARRRGLTVIEDACQSIGAEYKGRRAGSIGAYGCFSFFPSKNLGGAGDGGAITVQDKGLAGRLAILRVHGMEPKYYHQVIGGNFRLDALQAAVVLVKLNHLDEWTRKRQSNAARYDRLFAEHGLAAPDRVCLPKAAASRHVYNQYVIRVPRRDDLKRFLQERQVGTEVYYPVPLHLQECFAYLGLRKGSFPESERAAAETLALPIYPELTDDQAAWVVAGIAQFLGGKR
jgi:dTDP-4-amino-4,6-dideoxygalactose transaminase